MAKLRKRLLKKRSHDAQSSASHISISWLEVIGGFKSCHSRSGGLRDFTLYVNRVTRLLVSQFPLLAQGECEIDEDVWSVATATLIVRDCVEVLEVKCANVQEK